MKFLGRFVLVVMFMLLAGAVTFWWAAEQFTSPGPLPENRTIIFTHGTGAQAIADQLAAEGVVEHALYFKAAAVLTGAARNFKAGEYAIPAHISVQDVLGKLTRGEVVVHKLTVPEGLTTREVLALVAAEPILSGDLPELVPEGSLLPQTYHYNYGDTRASVVGRMKQAMDAAIKELWPTRQKDLPFTTVLEWVTLASIVEKETGDPSERPRVAAVYVNRLRKHIMLQADPTVIYGIEQMNGKPLGRALLSNDLLQATPYNTYVIDGLPPGPIANPGRASLEAAIQPLQTNELYFVATGTGGHRFATTLAEHHRNVVEYRSVMRGKAPVAAAEQAEEKPATTSAKKSDKTSHKKKKRQH